MRRDNEPLDVHGGRESADKSDALQTLRARGGASGPRVSVWSACVFSAAFSRLAAIRWPGGSWMSFLSFLRTHWDHELGRSGAPASGTAPGVIGAENRPCRSPAFRFMES